MSGQTLSEQALRPLEIAKPPIEARKRHEVPALRVLRMLPLELLELIVGFGGDGCHGCRSSREAVPHTLPSGSFQGGCNLGSAARGCQPNSKPLKGLGTKDLRWRYP